MRAIGEESQLSCFLRWSKHGSKGKSLLACKSMKVEFTCRQCGKTFVRYAYDKIVRCDACRTFNRKGGSP